jgi:hypothetical protein
MWVLAFLIALVVVALAALWTRRRRARGRVG